MIRTSSCKSVGHVFASHWVDILTFSRARDTLVGPVGPDSALVTADVSDIVFHVIIYVGVSGSTVTYRYNRPGDEEVAAITS